MKFPIVIITRKRWREMEVRMQHADDAINRLSHNIDDINRRLSATIGTIDSQRLEVRNIRKKLNEKQRQSWHGTFTGNTVSSR